MEKHPNGIDLDASFTRIWRNRQSSRLGGSDPCRRQRPSPASSSIAAGARDPGTGTATASKLPGQGGRPAIHSCGSTRATAGKGRKRIVSGWPLESPRPGVDSVTVSLAPNPRRPEPFPLLFPSSSKESDVLLLGRSRACASIHPSIPAAFAWF
ncbi:hypothetical protein SEVIR_7G181251v4 [Setaria viridis]